MRRRFEDGPLRPEVQPTAEGQRLKEPNRYLAAADKLHHHLSVTHSTGDSILLGPDPGIRFNARIGRFLKSYTRFLPWSDNLVYLQAQGYWILDNWLLHDLRNQDRYRDIAVDASESVLSLQRDDGYWDYPNPEWRGRIATVEGCFAALGLLESYARTGRQEFLVGAKRWHKYLQAGIGFRRQAEPGMMAVNYFAHSLGDGGGVPNNSTLVLWLLARLSDVTDDSNYLERAEPMIRWLVHVQAETGELPYALAKSERPDPMHFLCHQYNAFEFMDLVHYHRITGDDAVLPMMERLARFLSTGLTDGGRARYDCSNDTSEVVYYTAALAQALSQATELGLADYSQLADSAYDRLIAEQKPDGGFIYSRRSYGVFTDRRSYPRAQAMILHHLLRKSQTTMAEPT